MRGIYGFFHPKTGRCLYIGQSDDVEKRYKTHMPRFLGYHFVELLEVTDEAIPLIEIEDWFIYHMNPVCNKIRRKPQTFNKGYEYLLSIGFDISF